MLRFIAVFLVIATMFFLVGCDKNFLWEKSQSQVIDSVGENPATTQPTDDKNTLTRYQASFLELFDTVTFIVGYGATEAQFMAVAEEFKEEFTVYHELYDIYNDYSGVNNIKTINDSAGKEPVKVDERLIDLLEYGKEIYGETDGSTNIAMGSVLRIWHNYREEAINSGKGRVPPLSELEDAAKHMDINDVIINRKESTVYLKDNLMRLDVGSLGKGYAVERVCAEMESRGYTNIMVSVGGNVRAIGPRIDGTPWKAGIENPYGGDSFLSVVKVEDNSIVTSGNYQRYYMVGAERYHHIINPKTLFPENNFSAVAVLCDDSGYGDGVSTAIFNMSLEEGWKWVESNPKLEAMWMLPDETIVYSSGFEENVFEKEI